MLTQLEKSTILLEINLSANLVNNIKPVLDKLDAINNGSPKLTDTLTQANMDLEPLLSGLTKQQYLDGNFALTSTVKTALTTAYNALVELAARSQ